MEQNIAEKKEKVLTEDEILRKRVKSLVKKRYALKIHTTYYIAINLFLFILNYTIDYSYPWHLWSIIGWGVGLLMHGYTYISFKQNISNTVENGLFNYHVVIYAIISALLLIINYITLGVISWALWPIACWGIAVITHYYLYITSKPKSYEDPNKSYIERQIEKELSKIN